VFGHAGGPGGARPANWWKLRNPVRPSWGEPYLAIALRVPGARCPLPLWTCMAHP
jgi:hypothetical protein